MQAMQAVWVFNVVKLCLLIVMQFKVPVINFTGNSVDCKVNSLAVRSVESIVTAHCY